MERVPRVHVAMPVLVGPSERKNGGSLSRLAQSGGASDARVSGFQGLDLG